MPKVGKDLYALIKSGEIRVTITTSPPLLRFWKSVDKNGPIHPKYGRCWSWIGSTTPKGYGQFTVGGKNFRAHRWSYQTFKGPLARGICVLHRCDNPNCVRPAHLFRGTTEENQADKVEKDRQAKGSDNGYSKLTERQVKEIRSSYKRTSYHNSNTRALAAKYGVTDANIRYIINGTYWRHVS